MTLVLISVFMKLSDIWFFQSKGLCFLPYRLINSKQYFNFKFGNLQVGQHVALTGPSKTFT